MKRIKIVDLLLRNKYLINKESFYYLTILIIAIITFYPLFGTGIGSADDMANYLNTRFGKEFISARFLAEMSGRFYYLVVGLFHNLPFEVDNMFVIKMFHILPICLCIYLFYRIVLILTQSKEIASLFVLLFFVIAQVSRHTSLFVTYPFYFTFAFALILTAYLLLFRFQKTKKKRYLIFSALLFGVGLLFYEVFILFFGFAALSLLYHNFREGNRGFIFIRKTSLQLFPYVFMIICYGLAYVLYSHFHPSEYAGTTMGGGNVTVATFFQVLWKLSYTAFPLTVYDSLREFFGYKSELVDGYRDIVPYLFAHTHIEWLIKSILVFCLSIFLLARIPKVKYSLLIIGFAFSVMFTFFPHIPLALTVKYTYYVTTKEMQGYLTTFFSLFGVVLFLAILCSFILNFTKCYTIPRYLLTVAISCALVLCSFLTDFSNYYVTQDIHQANIRMRVVDEMIKTEPFKSIPQSSNIYAAQLWEHPFYMASGVTEQGFLWTYYIMAKSGILQNMIRDQKAFLDLTRNKQDPCYRIEYFQAYKSDDALLILAQLPPPSQNDSLISVASNKVMVVFYSKYKQFSLSFKRFDPVSQETTKIKVNHINEEINPGKNVEFTVYNTRFNDPITIFTIETSSIDIRSIRVSNLINPESKVFYL
ncbi:MAG: hypothetical protein EOM90_08130 [Alphaproteobacteria bacterium]|nr:hypothetical protein [Alphaproteobacteria bacterium]